MGFRLAVHWGQEKLASICTRLEIMQIEQAWGTVLVRPIMIDKCQLIPVF